MTLAIPLPSIPFNAPRRSWILRQMQELRFGLEWHGMLKQLSPVRARALSPFNAMECYRALWTHIDENMFPLFEPPIDDLDERDGWTEASYAWDAGIPCDVCGIDDWNVDEGAYNATVMLAAALARQDADLFACKDELSRLPMLPIKYSARPGRGREWIAPWGDVGLLLDYAAGNIGLAFLNWSHNAIMDGGEYPRWDIDEITGLAADWKKAKPIWKRINDLIDYVESKDDHLRLLHGLIIGDKTIREQLTKPKGRRLIQLFK